MEFKNKTFQVDENDIITDFENIKFYRRKPHVLYTIEFLWMEVFSSLSDGNDFEITLNDLYERIKEFYPTWANIQGEQDQVRLSWVKEAMDTLVKIDYCDNILKSGKYKVLYKKNPGHDLRENIAEKICNNIKGAKQSSIQNQGELQF